MINRMIITMVLLTLHSTNALSVHSKLTQHTTSQLITNVQVTSPMNVESKKIEQEQHEPFLPPLQ